MNLKKLSQSLQTFIKNPPPDFDPAVDMNDAMLVIERLQELDYQVNIQITDNGTDVYLSTKYLNSQLKVAHHESTPAAICLLALKVA